MKKLLVILLMLSFVSCVAENQEDRDRKLVNQQQSQYAKGQPVPVFDWSLERHLVTELYRLRNKKVSTHAVWRGDHSIIEGDCPSMGFGLPYDTSLTNPLRGEYFQQGGVATVEQAEPNGIFASKNTNATWVMCVNTSGAIEPVYVESKVTIYPYPVEVDYRANRVRKAGKATVFIK